MIRYVGLRLATAIPTLLLVIAASFFLLRAAPGGPFDTDRALPADVEANLNARYGLDLPMHEQFFKYVGGLFRGDFGPSYRYKDVQVSEIIADQLPISLTIGFFAFLFTVGFGITLGVIAALNQNSRTDYLISGGTAIGVAVPSFVSAPILAMVFGVMLGILPVAGWGGGHPAHLVLPVIALGIPNAAYVARLMRGSMLENLSSDYIRTARAKGLNEGLIIRRHVIPPALLPVISYLGPATAAILTGSVVIEKIFALPGTGLAFVDGALNRDYTLVLGLVIIYAGLVILLNLLTDILYGFLDPRMRVET